MTATAPPAIAFFVRGQAVTKGSMIVRHQHGSSNGMQCSCRNYAVAMFDARLKEWNALIATAAARAMGHEMPFSGPVGVILHFYFPRPASHTRAERLQGYVATKGRWDADKLSRAVLDALTDSAIWGDDGQVAELSVRKRYADDEHPAGVMVSVAALT